MPDPGPAYPRRHRTPRLIRQLAVLTSAAPTADTWAMPTAATDTNKEALFRELNQHIHELGGFGETAHYPA